MRCHALLLLLLVWMMLPPPVAADPRWTNIRTTDRRLRGLVADGARASPTFRALVARLERSDVVVYLVCEGHANARVAGRLTFVSAVAGVRYVAVRMARLPRPQQIAILGHELQHAAEVADDPSIVDVESLARAYLRIGHRTDRSPLEGLAFDTTAAVYTGQQVLHEIGE